MFCERKPEKYKIKKKKTKLGWEEQGVYRNGDIRSGLLIYLFFFLDCVARLMCADYQIRYWYL